MRPPRALGAGLPLVALMLPLGVQLLPLSLPARADAQEGTPPRMALAYERAPEALACEPAEAFTARLARQLGRPPFAAEGEDAEATLRIDLRREGEVWIALLRREQEGLPLGGARDLRMATEGCEPLMDALALIVALIVEPGWSGPPEPQAEPSEPPPSAALGVPHSGPPVLFPDEESGNVREADDSSENEPAGGAPRGWGVHAFGVFLAGWLPNPAFGGGLRVALWPDPIWSIELSVAALGAEPLNAPVGSVTFVGVRAGLDLCARPLVFEILRLGGCAGIYAGGLYASPSLDTGGGQDALSPHLDLAASVHLALLPLLELLPGLELRLSAGAAAVLLRGAFTADTLDFGPILLHEVEPVLATASLGVALRI